MVKSQLAMVCKTRKNPQLREKCLNSFQYTNSSQVSQHTIGYTHANSLFPKNGYELATHYFFSVRLPLRRLSSWYVYNHPRSCDPRESNSPSCKKNAWKQRFFTCFPTLEELGSSFAQLLDANPDDCARTFWKGWYGVVENKKFPNHLYWNYLYYHNETRARGRDKGIMVIRQESLAKDLTALDDFLGDGKSTPTRPEDWRRPDSRHYLTGRVSNSLSAPSIRSLCCLLQQEISIYENLVRAAENLNPSEKQDTLMNSLRSCGAEESWEDLHCPQLPSMNQFYTS